MTNETYRQDETPDVSIVLPAYNEENAITGVIDAIRAAMSPTPYRYEILVVDDCSTDATAERAAEKGVRVVRHPVNRGSGAARRTGILEARGEIVVMLDADGSYDAASIPRLLEYFPEYDQVNGARTSEQGTYKQLRRAAKALIRWLAIYLSGTKIPDLNTGLKAFKRPIMLNYLWVLPDGFSCVTSMTLAFLTNGYRVHYIPTPYYPRIGKSKFHPLADTAAYLATVVRLCTYFRPLRVYGPLSLVFTAVGLAKSIYDVLLRAEKHSLEESDIILVTAGVLLAAIGLLADLIVAQRRGGR
ncbi:MAG: glycosyltransferase family 2 protein [Candidatus Sumerlaeaceae bacterium]